MPIFEYACDDCGTKFEKLVRRSVDAEAVRCPSCGEDHLTTQYSTFAARATSNQAGMSSDFGGCGSGACGMGACQSGACGMDVN